MTPSRRHSHLLPATLALTVVYAVILGALTRDGLWHDELWSLWAVRPETLAGMLARIRADYHPPLYFLLLDGWVALTGDSALAMRSLSALAAMLGAAATYHLGRRLFDAPTGALAVLILGAAGMFRYYAGETRMYSLLLALAALCMMAFLAWIRRPNAPRTLIYAALLAALLYTHYHGVWIVPAQALILVAFHRRRLLPRWIIPTSIAALLVAPWLPVLIDQNRQRPTLLLSAALPSDLATVRWIVAILTSGLGAALLLPYLFRPDLALLRRHARSLIIVTLWLIAPPALLLIANTRLNLFYHPRYLIGVLPAGALIAAWGVRIARWKPLAIMALAILIGMQLARYREFWPSRSAAYEAVFEQLYIGEGDFLILDLHPDNLVGYYDRHADLGLRERASLDLTDRPTDLASLPSLADELDRQPRVWLIAPSNAPRTAFVLASLDAAHDVAFGGSVENMLFYRFEPGNRSTLRFHFGSLLEVLDAPSAAEVITHSAAPLCLNLTLRALAPLDGRYSAGLHLVEASGQSRGQWDGGLGAPADGETVTLSPCLPAAPPGEYVLQLTIYDWTTLARLPLMEVSTGQPVAWGDTLVLSVVTLAPPAR